MMSKTQVAKLKHDIKDQMETDTINLEQIQKSIKQRQKAKKIAAEKLAAKTPLRVTNNPEQALDPE